MAQSVEPASANADTPKDLTIGQRFKAIRNECAGIGKQAIKMKSKAGGEFTINAHTVEAVLAEVRPLLDRYGLDLTPTLVERIYTGNRCDVLVDFRFEIVDDSEWVGDTRMIRWGGAGTDDHDKGFAKAGTNALKEMLKKVFLITDREDAKEEEDKVEHKPDGGATRAEVDKAKDAARAAHEQWAKTFKAALEKATDLKSIQRLERENKPQMENEDLPEVTRDFFAELIETRKKAVAAA